MHELGKFIHNTMQYVHNTCHFCCCIPVCSLVLCLMVEHVVTVWEGSSFHILTRKTDVNALFKKWAKRQGFA